jgi:hypothetical protein
MNASSPSIDRPLLARICRVTTLDRVALTFAVLFLFGVAAVAALSFVAIGDAPQGRMWSFLVTYAGLGLGVGIVAPWALCRMLHAAGHAAQISRSRRAERARQAEPLMAFYQGRVA